jgi:subtilisin family serine protease
MKMKKYSKKLTSVILCLLIVFTNMASIVEASSNQIKNDKVQENVVDNVYNNVTNSVYVDQNIQVTQPKDYLVRFKKNVDRDKFVQKKGLKGKSLKKMKSSNSLVLNLSSAEAINVKKDTDVELIENNSVVGEASVGIPQKLDTKKSNSKDNNQTIPWGMYAIGANYTLEHHETGKKIKVAVLDSGIANHPDLNVAGGISFVEGTSSYLDDNGHGTHVAGTIAAQKNKIGVVGVAPSIDLYAVKVLDKNGVGNYAQVIQGIDWAIDNNIDIISMSFGGYDNSEILHDAIKTANSKGILIVAAAGNFGSGEEKEVYPALFPETISVGAVDKADQRASFSSTGSEIDVVAPGTDILSTWNDGGYDTLSGTSMAVPHVTGAAAVIWSKNKKMTSEEIKQTLFQTSTPLGNAKEYGHGIINLAKALNLVNGPIAPLEKPGTIPISTPTPNASGASSSFNINKIDKYITTMSSQLLVLKDRAIKAKNNKIAKEIQDHYNQLIIENNKYHELPENFKNISKKERTSKASELNSYFSQNASAFNKISEKYKQLIQEYSVLFPNPTPGDNQIGAASFDPIGDNQSIHQGESAFVTITESNFHPEVDIIVTNIATGNVVDTDVYYQTLGEYNPYYTWYTDASIPVGTYNIQFHYPDNNYETNFDDNFTIYVIAATNANVPDQPTNAAVTTKTESSLTLTWSASNYANNYDLYLNNNYVNHTTGTSYTFTPLASNMTYTLGVRATNSSGQSQMSIVVDSTLAPQPTVPDAPTITTSNTTDTSITLNWSPSIGANIYNVMENGVVVGTTSNNYYVFTGLSPLTSYSLGVAAVNDIGTSGYSLNNYTTKATSIFLNNPVDVNLPSSAYKIYAFKPLNSGIYDIYTGAYGGIGLLNDTILDIYTDSEQSNLIATNDDSNGSIFSEISQTLQANVTYYIKIYGYDTDVVHARLTVSPLTSSIPPITLQSPVDIATNNSGESRVYQFTTTSSGQYDINTNYYGGTSNSGENDTQLSIFTDINLSNMIGNNDDTSGSTFSDLNIHLNSNTTYYIEVSGYGDGILYTRLLVNIENPIIFNSISNQQSVDANTAPFIEAYYTFTPTATGHYRIFTSAYQGTGGGDDTFLALYSDASLSNLLTSNDDSLGTHPYGETFSKIDYVLNQGQTYYINLRNYDTSTAMQARLTVEDDFDDIRADAQQINWEQLYDNNRISSLFDIDYFKVTLAEEKQVHINVSQYSVFLEDESGNILSAFFAGNSEVINLEPGNYYIRAQYVSPNADISALSTASSFTGYNYNFSPQSGKVIDNSQVGTTSYGNSSEYEKMTTMDATPMNTHPLTFTFNYLKLHPNSTIRVYFGTYNNSPLVFQTTFTTNSIGAQSYDWGGLINQNVIMGIPYTMEYGGNSVTMNYARDGIYRVEISPEEAQQYATIYHIRISNDPTAPTNQIPPVPDTNEYGQTVTASNKNSCELCLNYFIKYVWDPSKQASQALQLVGWLKDMYGLNGLERFWDGAEKFFYDPGQDALDNLTNMIDKVSMIPVFSEVSGINTIIYLIRGDTSEAALAALNIIPFVKDGRVGAKAFRTLHAISDICNCFAAGTKVWTDQGEMPIEQIKVGDKVLSKDPVTGQSGYKNVETVVNKEIADAYQVTVGSEVITTTNQHLFWVHNKGWLETQELSVGDQFETSSGSYVAVDKIEVIQEPTTVYNFSVQDFHTYYVTNLQILTHNSVCLTAAEYVEKNVSQYYDRITTVTGSPSFILRAEMEAADISKPVIEDVDNWAAHHIVPAGATDVNAERAREIIEDVGIDVNSVSNGVWLPMKKGESAAEVNGIMIATHNGRHVDDYSKYVRDALEPLYGNKALILAKIETIRGELLTGVRRLGNLSN